MFNKKFTSVLLSSLLIAGSLVIPNGSVSAAGMNGWKSDSSNWYYYSNDAMFTGWLKEGSNWYYLNGNGKMATGWNMVKSKWYYFNSNGTMAANTTIDGWSAGADGVFYQVFNMGKTALIKDTLWGTYELTINNIEAVTERNKFDNSNPADVYKITYTYKLISKGSSTDSGLYVYGFDAAAASGKEAASYPNTLKKVPKELVNVGDSCTAETFIAVNSKAAELTLTKQFFSKAGSDLVKFIIPTK